MYAKLGRLVNCGILAAAASLAAACMVEGPDVGSTGADMTFEEFERAVYQEPDTGLYIVNGDEPVNGIDELRAFYDRVFGDGELIVHQSGGNDVRWDDTQKLNITYCVSSSSFGGNYGRVVAALDEATAGWEAVANVNFVHSSSNDSNCTNRTGGVVFNVRQVQSGQYLASAFFPNYSRRNRELKVDTTSFYWDDTGDISLVGIMRHELGHTIGFRHEHTRPESGTCFEDNNWRALTPYDSESVMHYPQCNGDNTWELPITTRDGQGAAALYGAPGGPGPDPDPDPDPACYPAGADCSANGDCCSNKCHKRFNYCQ